ncbi:hypothetical protein [Psychroflexus salis]|uniref:Uncharacterized protein n=1 Tax=Psychroflexus salis TaxID=1526574 RepID=A0A917A3H1_9FLAO|nr:hypothetical protein [Psychroflexus salis]GGE23218.1 hypothetical protein GCM10010831_25130 [Psychroflexus salis]
MKKLVLTLVLGVFAFGSSGFNSNELRLQSQSQYCFELQHDAFAFHYNNGASSDEAWEESIEVYERCERKRGNY